MVEPGKVITEVETKVVHEEVVVNHKVTTPRQVGSVNHATNIWEETVSNLLTTKQWKTLKSFSNEEHIMNPLELNNV